MFFTPFGCWGGISRGVGHNLLLCSFPASAAQKWLSLCPLRGALPKAIEFTTTHLLGKATVDFFRIAIHAQLAMAISDFVQVGQLIVLRCPVCRSSTEILCLAYRLALLPYLAPWRIPVPI